MNLPFTKITEIPIGPINIQVWGIMVAIGMLAALWLGLKEAKRHKIKSEVVFDLFLWIVVSSLVGSRLLYVFLFWENFAQEPLRIFKLWEGGMVFLGGVFAAVTSIWVYVKWKKIKFWKIIDTIAPGLGIGIFFGRIGCYLIGDHIGAPMKGEYFWGSVIPGEEVLRHEPSLYLSINGLLLFFLMWHLRKHLKTTGQLSMVFFIWYGLSRFMLDFFRATDLVGASDPRFLGLTISQYFSVAIFLFGLAALQYPQILKGRK
ncbi:MAG: prolipoprotein diacylglyceryl transferase [Candidatus Peregrinibacteria bacterium]|nr:prolipoprotein diacylglyceryl transferase [Candidatus Peregrinibacteria bacterium]